MDELRGLADGSKMEFYVLFLNMLQEEFSYVVPSHFSYTPATHCSDYIMKTEDNAYIVHTEDGSGMMDFNHTILVSEEVYHRTSPSPPIILQRVAWFRATPHSPTPRRSPPPVDAMLSFSLAYGWHAQLAFTRNSLLTPTTGFHGSTFPP